MVLNMNASETNVLHQSSIVSVNVME